MKHGHYFVTRAGAALVALLSSSFVLPLAPSAEASVATTRHNLSVSGPGTRKATSETEICIFCHAPHNTSPSGQLWNRRQPAGTFVPYTSSTLRSTPGQPNGASLLCLSCHDGTIALGSVMSRTTNIAMAGGALTGNALLGTNLSDDHPVSLVYDAALSATRGQLANPATLTGRVRLDSGGRLQCTSCHDPHDDSFTNFLVMANTASALCTTCHQMSGWTQSDHRTSTRVWTGAGTDPWPHTPETTVAANACANCHRPHTAGGARSLVNYAAEEANCFSCHNGNVATRNVQAEFAKASTHRVSRLTGVHTPVEGSPPTVAHAECVDCHNPHAARADTPHLPNRGGTAIPTLSGALAGVRGLTITGAPINPAQHEYEICLRCHSRNNPVPSRTPRQFNTTPTLNDIRAEFNPATAQSFHPVAASPVPGVDRRVPSLRSPWTVGSRILCTDCHNNNAGPYSTGTGTTPVGTGVNGPHGSTISPLLERRSDRRHPRTAAWQPGSALCLKCHSETVIWGDHPDSFTEHRLHLEADGRSSCNECHDPHGVPGPAVAGTSKTRLINFDTSVVFPNSRGQLYWRPNAGRGGGTCSMLCHGEDHDNEGY